mgnify:CR=1 FL=1
MQKKRDIIKKVIAYMTLGIDVSRLFSDMIMVSAVSECSPSSAMRQFLLLIHSNNDAGD